jgi:peptidoglycan hydrolase-like protein with peptidoglycan-binding domain
LTNFRYGSRLAPDVTKLQEILIAEKLLLIPAPTGWFGPMTLAAVKKYQAARSIPATGNVFILTRTALNAGI